MPVVEDASARRVRLDESRRLTIDPRLAAEADVSTCRNHSRVVSAANMNATRMARTLRREVDFSI